MATLAKPPVSASIPGECTVAGRHYPVLVTQLTSNGCRAEVPAGSGHGWDHETDFCTLSIAGQVVTNGRIAPLGGRSAQIAFYGHIHPLAVEKLKRVVR